MAERIRFFGLSDNKLFYDERKKRFVFLEDAPAYVEKAFKNNYFKEVFIFIEIACCSNHIIAKTRPLWIRTS